MLAHECSKCAVKWDYTTVRIREAGSGNCAVLPAPVPGKVSWQWDSGRRNRQPGEHEEGSPVGREHEKLLLKRIWV